MPYQTTQTHTHPNQYQHQPQSQSQPHLHPHSYHPSLPFSLSHDSAVDFPFPALVGLNRSRLLHLLEYQCRICEQPDGSGGIVDPDSLQHYRTLLSSIRSLNLNGGVYNFSFVHSSSIASELLGSATPKSAHGGQYTAKLTANHLLDILRSVRGSQSPNLAGPNELPAPLLDAGIYYRPDEDKPAAMQLSPFVYHRTLALLSLLLNLHIHQLTLSRILRLLEGIEVHLSYWLSHQALTSLPLPYRVWKFIQYHLVGGTAGAASATSFSSSFTGLHSPKKKYREDDPAAAAPPPSGAASYHAANPYSKWTKLAARNVRELVDLKKRWTTRCGRIAIRMHRLQEWLNAAFGKNDTKPTGPQPTGATTAAAIAFHEQIRLNEIYFSKIYKYVTREDRHASVSPSASAGTIQQKIYALYTQFSSVEHYLVSFDTQFVRWFEREIDLRRKPHHLFEYWHYYATVGAVLVGATVYAARNQDEVKEAAKDTLKSMKFFMHEHLWEPLGHNTHMHTRARTPF